MKKIGIALICCLSFQIGAFEYELQFENDQICVAKVKILPHEEIELFHDAYPQLVIALRGGTITHLEPDGRVLEVNFPTGVGVFREDDSENELRRSVNLSPESVELITIQLKNNMPICRKTSEKSYDVAIDIKMSCPMSTELNDFIKSIPPSGNYASGYEEWKSSFINNMNQLIRLVESKKVFNSFWSVKTDDIATPRLRYFVTNA